MKNRHIVFIGILLIGIILIGGCMRKPEKPEGTLSVSELLENPVYDTEVKIYGQVSDLGELFCPCLGLTSGEERVEVWYDLMVEDGKTPRPAVSVEGIENGDWVVVTGELRSSDGLLPSRTFWAGNIEKR